MLARPISFWKNRSGAIAIIFAIALPTVLIASLAGLDYFMAFRQESRLQQLVDTAALAGAKELSLSNARTEGVASVVDAVVKSYFGAMRDTKNANIPTVTTKVTESPLRVEVIAQQAFTPVLGGTFGLSISAVKARAVAEVIGKPNICVLTLSPTAVGALSLEHKARVTGENCAVYSNSTHNAGIKSKNDARLSATVICSAGGIQGSGGNFNPDPYVDCPAFSDPLASRVEPAAAACDPSLPTVITSSRQIWPATYCGLTISNGAEVTLQPGVYIFKNNPLIVRDNGVIRGKGVGLFFSGDGATFDFQGASTINLEAPESGPMAGLLIFTSRSTTGQNKIYSENAQVMVGTIYVPAGELRIDGAAEIGTSSAYTAIVADKLRIYGGPHIKLNTNFDATTVPVPNAIKGAGQPITLVE
jgi:Flp pilus assembly protein TadG